MTRSTDSLDLLFEGRPKTSSRALGLDVSTLSCRVEYSVSALNCVKIYASVLSACEVMSPSTAACPKLRVCLRSRFFDEFGTYLYTRHNNI